jgi:O-succinylbenzoic acid--CoA ligase
VASFDGLRRGDLVAAAMPPGGGWIDLLRRAWAAGSAVLPVDHRLPRPEVDALLSVARPTARTDGKDVERDPGGVPADDGVALVVATSGSAGRPKLAELTHDALAASLSASAERLGATGEDAWLCCLPVAHMGGMLVLLRAAIQGAPVAVHGFFDVDAFQREATARFTSLVPTQVARLLDAGADLSRYRAILVGGSGLPRELEDRARATGAATVATYGLTETSGGCVYDGVALDGVELRIGAGDEILLRGPVLMRAYRNDSRATEEAVDGDGWLRTRDAGEVVDGRLRVLGRLDDLIVTGGEKVWPEEVEAVLRAHPDVADVAVVGRPDPEWGARVTAFVVPAAPAAAALPETLRRFVAERLARHKVPRDVEVVASLPRSPVGKVLRTRLRGGDPRNPREIVVT